MLVLVLASDRNRKLNDGGWSSLNLTFLSDVYIDDDGDVGVGDSFSIDDELDDGGGSSSS